MIQVPEATHDARCAPWLVPLVVAIVAAVVGSVGVILFVDRGGATGHTGVRATGDAAKQTLAPVGRGSPCSEGRTTASAPAAG